MRSVVVAVALMGIGFAARARAEMPASVTVAGEGECPSPAAVARALGRLHPALRVDGGGVQIAVVDRGARYEVRAGERARVLEDAARRCAERATAAALAVTLLLDPPSAPPVVAVEEAAGPEATKETPAGAGAAAPTPVPTPTLTPTPTPTPTPTRAPTSASRDAAGVVTRTAPTQRRRPSRIDLELVGLLEGAPAVSSAASEITGGAAVRLAVGGRHVAGTLGFTGLAPATATSSAIDVRVVRLPFDVGVRLLLPVGRFEPGVDAGLVLAILQLSAPTLDGAATSTRLDVGARVAPFVRVELTARLALVVGMQMIVSFAPYDLVVTNLGQIATTPRLWLGGGIGLAARL